MCSLGFQDRICVGMFPEVHFWCNTCQYFDGQHQEAALSEIHVARSQVRLFDSHSFNVCLTVIYLMHFAVS